MPEFPDELLVAGVDLAWGERRPDGVCLLEARPHSARVLHVGLCRGDAELLTLLQPLGTRSAWICLDAPVVCPNATGARPVDREAHREFGRYPCGTYPANQRLCARPVRLSRQFQEAGFTPGWLGPRLLIEVYPHPALVRWFQLPQRIPYKKGPVAQRRAAFRDLQDHLRQAWPRLFPEVERTAPVERLLGQSWTKDVEDQTDALLAALIGYWHWRHQGRKTQVLGDVETGFLLVPMP